MTDGARRNGAAEGDDHSPHGVPAPPVEYVGPFNTTHVVMDGRRVPFLTASHLGDRVSLTLDDRFGLDLTVAEAETVVPFIAEVIAVALGYACFPRAGEDPVKRPTFPFLTELAAVRSTDAGGNNDA